MIAFTYEKQVVLTLFAQAKPGQLNPRSTDLEAFDRRLRDANEALLATILPQNGLTADTPTKSAVLAFRPHMPGNTLRSQIENACTYLINTTNALSALPDPGK
jgi:hypothetical protein